jgi:hypothetical protein
MLTRLHLHDFKNFQSATLPLGPLTLLLGLNAAGKSNVRDALRFLHGVARGYTLADIIGEKWGEGGVRLCPHSSTLSGRHWQPGTAHRGAGGIKLMEWEFKD